LAARIVNSEGEQVMTTPEQPTPDQTGTWEPDYNALWDSAWENEPSYSDSPNIESVIAEYRRQQAAQGIVEVAWQDAEVLLWWALIGIERSTPLSDEPTKVADRVKSILGITSPAAAKGQDR
jgi:hypothetical protein